MKNKKPKPESQKPEIKNQTAEEKKVKASEVGGRGGLDPARFGDWEIAGKCVDF